MSNFVSQSALWPQVLEILKEMFPVDVFDTWFAPLRDVIVTEDSITLEAPNDFACIWLEDNYLDIIRDRMSRIANRPIEVSFSTKVEERSSVAASNADTENRLFVSAEASSTKGRVRSRSASSSTPAASGFNRQIPLNINPKNTFDNFIVGPCNQLAHAACMGVADSPGISYNPLFLYGDTGLGKTHLMHAVAHCIQQNRSDLKVLYVSCEKFTNAFMEAIQNHSLDKFRKFYRTVDVLLIDDIQFLEGKERTQEEFFHTFNELYESQKQICLSSDRPASEITKLQSRLVSRFHWGMVTDMHAPDFETRVAILTRKAKALNYKIPADVLEFLAEKITKNVRRMEGALLKVATYASLMNGTLDIRTVENLVCDILREEAQNQITIEKIQRRVVEFYDLRIADMMSKRRPSNIAFPRQIAMYLSRVLTNKPLKEIGDAFGGRDHGTVIHAYKTVENIMAQDENVKRQVENLTNQLTHLHKQHKS